MSRVLVVYYSWANGNTEKIAMKLANHFNADLCGIDPVKPYPEDYETTVEIGKYETEHHVSREILPLQYNPEDYDVIAIGTPTWWYTMAPCVKTFLESYDFSNKKIILFMTNAGWPGTVIKDMKAKIKDAEIISESEILFDSQGCDKMITTCKELNEWIASITF